MQTLANILAGVPSDPTQVNPGISPQLIQQALLQGAMQQQMQPQMPGSNQPVPQQSQPGMGGPPGQSAPGIGGLGLALGLY